MKITIYNTKRKSWMFKPTTRIKVSSKLYNRKRLKQVLTPVEVDECYSDMWAIELSVWDLSPVFWLCGGVRKQRRVSDTNGGFRRDRGYRPKGLESTYIEIGKLRSRNRMLLKFWQNFFGFSIWIFCMAFLWFLLACGLSALYNADICFIVSLIVWYSESLFIIESESLLFSACDAFGI